METVYDWLTLALFAGLIVLFLQRSSAAEPRDSLLAYLLAGVGCATVNYLGNEGWHIPAILALAVLLGFIHWKLKPLSRWNG